MIPSDHFFVGGGAAETVMTPVAVALLMIAVVMMLFGPRKYMMAPLLLAVFLVPMGNVIVSGGFHITPIRLLAPVGWLRLAMPVHPETKSRFAIGYNNIDSAFLGLNIATAIAVWLQWMTMSAIVNQLGVLEGTLLMYFLLRQLIRNEEDIAMAIKLLVVVAVVSVLGMTNEHLTQHNLFGTVIGGVQATPLIREGKIRAEGPFQHAILAGVFGATTLPLALWLLKTGRSSGFAVIGIVSATIMTVLSASSTPIMAYGGTILTVCVWPMRRSMRLLRWGLGLTLITLQLVMKAPVWFLIARIDVVGGSASYDRANLIDACVRHFGDWWLYGTHNTGNYGWSMWDLSDTFVSVAETGGLLALILFIAVISRGFARLGSTRQSVAGLRKKEWGLWLLGAALFSHVMAYFGVNYFDQTQVAWLVVLAIISVATNRESPEEINTSPVATETAFLLEQVGATADSPWWSAEGAGS